MFTLSYSGHIGLIRSTLFPFNPIRFIQSYLVHLVYFGPLQSIQYYSVPFSPLWSYSVYFTVHSILFDPFSLLQSIRYYSLHSVLFDLFGPLWSYAVDFGPLQSINYYSVCFGSIRSTLVLFGPFRPLQCIRYYSVYCGPI